MGFTRATRKVVAWKDMWLYLSATASGWSTKNIKIAELNTLSKNKETKKNIDWHIKNGILKKKNRAIIIIEHYNYFFPTNGAGSDLGL